MAAAADVKASTAGQPPAVPSASEEEDDADDVLLKARRARRALILAKYAHVQETPSHVEPAVTPQVQGAHAASSLTTQKHASYNDDDLVLEAAMAINVKDDQALVNTNGARHVDDFPEGEAAADMIEAEIKSERERDTLRRLDTQKAEPAEQQQQQQQQLLLG